MEIKAPLKKSFIENYGEGKQKLIAVFDTTTKPEWPEILAVTFLGKSIEGFNQLNLVAGEQVNVSFNVKSREYQGKYFTEANGWKVERVNAAPTYQQEPAPVQTSAPQKAVQTNKEHLDANNDLPF